MIRAGFPHPESHNDLTDLMREGSAGYARVGVQTRNYGWMIGKAWINDR